VVRDSKWEVKGVGDFNGDGKADVLWQDTVSGWTLIWFMDGATKTSTGVPKTSAGAPAQMGDTAWQIKQVGDFNGDGKADVLWHHAGSGQTLIWLMDGATIISVGVPGVVSDPNWQVKGVGDFNGDGKADVLWHHATSGQTAIWLMDGEKKISVGAPGIVK
jgi:hypothetical protein